MKIVKNDEEESGFEIVVVKVRPSYADKKLHVLRFLFADKFDSNLVYQKLSELFPNGFYPPKIERFMIDYAFFFDQIHICEPVCSHGYLSIYSTGSFENK